MAITRTSRRRPARKTYCLVVEGEVTERNYFIDAKAEFDQLDYERVRAHYAKGKRHLQVRSLQVVVAGGRSFVNVINVALKQVPLGHEKVWCIVDADFYVRLSGAQRKEAEAKYLEAVKEGIDVVFSRPCFEVWFRHHFNADSSAWVNGDRAKTEIQKLWPQYLDQPTRHWELLHDRINDAIQNADRVRAHHESPPNLVENCDASTHVDMVINELFCSQDPDE